MTVQIVVLGAVDAIGVVLGIVGVVCHSIAHLLGDVRDDDSILGLDIRKFLDNHIELDEQLPILLIGAIAVKSPTILIDGGTKVSEQGFLLGQWYGHVIFDRVQATEDQVEDGHRQKKLGMKFLYHRAEASTCLIEEVEASLLIGTLVV